MKTAMEKKTGLMRLIGYLSFVVVLLYGITLFAVSCDNDEDPPLPPAVEKVVLAFGVDQGEGQLSAKPELENTAAEKIGELISPAEIAKGNNGAFSCYPFQIMDNHVLESQWRHYSFCGAGADFRHR